METCSNAHVLDFVSFRDDLSEGCMSGGGGGGAGSRPAPITPVTPKKEGGDGGGIDPCALTEDTVINSPVAAVIARLNVGDVLIVELERGPPVRLIVRTKGGNIAGAITSAKLPQIITCIETGVRYQALVTSIRGGAVRVRVSNA